jgi:recombination protein RecT
MATVPTTQKKTTITAYLQDPFIMKQIERAIPKHMTSDRLLRVFLTCIQGNQKLMDCTPKSLLGCLMTSAQLGLEPSSTTGHAAIIPYKREAQFQIMYKGLLALVRRSGELQSVQAQVVYTKDHFVLQYGLEDKLEHIPTDGDRGEAKGSYCVFRYSDGGYSFDYMSKHDIEKVRKTSRAANDGPWVSHWDEMAKKTVIKRHCKLAPVSIEVQTAAALDDRIQMGASQMDLLGEGEPIDIQAEPGAQIEEGEEGAQQNEDAYWQLHASLPNELDKNSLHTFVEETATANTVKSKKIVTVGDVVCSVTDETKDAFLAQFRAWQKEPLQTGQPPEKQEPADLDNARTISEFKDRKNSGFAEWLLAHKDEIPAMPGEVLAALEKKCKASLYKVSLAETLKLVSGEQEPAQAPETMVPCPDADGDMRSPSYCNSEGEFVDGKGCRGREGCRSWPTE